MLSVIKFWLRSQSIWRLLFGDVLELNGNTFGVINSQALGINPWSLPFYDRASDNVDFIVWNTKKSLIDWLLFKNLKIAWNERHHNRPFR